MKMEDIAALVPEEGVVASPEVFQQLGALPHSPSCLDFFVSQSSSTACCPIFACSRVRSRSKSSTSPLLPPAPKALAAFWTIILFHSETCTG